MTEDALKARIRELEEELKRKDEETNVNLDRIGELEEIIMRLEALIPEEDEKKKSRKRKVWDSKLAIELDEKNKLIRKLKDEMGFLRKEKIRLQRELEKIKSANKDSSVIRVEDLRSELPLNDLVKELQDTVSKQRSLINKFKTNKVDNKDILEKSRVKDEEIEILKSEISQLKQKLKDFSPISNDKSDDFITKKLIEDLQQELNKTKRQVSDLKQKLAKLS
ncbi:MAG: hypothetical protein CEE43_05170 [Promethearchaeota archaeon Loki_b32]|nr:MAG: hypothetical protein CEE43_05170 [Candidatus Lokiarchaeota archaeon Loki_b32]